MLFCESLYPISKFSNDFFPSLYTSDASSFAVTRVADLSTWRYSTQWRCNDTYSRPSCSCGFLRSAYREDWTEPEPRGVKIARRSRDIEKAWPRKNATFTSTWLNFRWETKRKLDCKNRKIPAGDVSVRPVVRSYLKQVSTRTNIFSRDNRYRFSSPSFCPVTNSVTRTEFLSPAGSNWQDGH